MDCMQSLYCVLNGNTATREEGSIISALKNSRSRLHQGILHFKPPSEKARSQLDDQKSVRGIKLEFVKKASVLLNLDELQSLQVFQLYLAEEYKDTPTSLNNTLQNIKTQQVLLIQLLKFYFAERLACIQCLFYLLSHLKNEDHPLHEAVKLEIESMNNIGDVRKSLTNQIKSILQPGYFNVTVEDENLMSGHSIKSIFASELLKELTELLKTQLVYNHHFPHTQESYLIQSSLVFSQIISHDSVLISGLGLMLTLDGLDIDYIFEHFDKDKTRLEKYYLLEDKALYDKLNSLYCTLPATKSNAPLLIAWAVLRYSLATTSKDQAESRHLGQQGLKGGGVGSILAFLTSPALYTCSVTLQLSRIIVYKVLATTLTIFHEDTLGDTNVLARVISEVLQEEMLALEFWDACAEKGVAVILSSAASAFPHAYKPLTSICYSLASSTSSCDRLVQYISSLSLFTTEMPRNTFYNMVVETDVEWMYTNPSPVPLTADREFVVKPNTQCNLLGTTSTTAVVQWLHDYSLFSYLDNELLTLIRWSGSTSDKTFCWRLERVTDMLSVVYKLAKHFQEIIEVITVTIERVSTVVTKLRSDMLEHVRFTSVALKLYSVIPYKTSWSILNNISFIPKFDTSFGGVYANILNYYERPNTQFPVTVALLKLLKRCFGIKQFLLDNEHINMSISVLLFVLQDVFCGLQKWRFDDPLVKLKMSKSILVVIKSVLTYYSKIKEDTNDNNQYTMSLIEEQLLPALYSGSAHVTLLNMVSWCNVMDNPNVEYYLQKKVCSVVSHTLTILSLIIKLSPSLSGLEHALVACGADNMNITSLIASYTYQSYSSKVSLHATRLLTDIATTDTVSLYSALGSTTVPLSLVFVNRLTSRSQNVYIKSSILDFISAAVEAQPSVTELFMNIEKDNVIGESSCLQPVLDYIKRAKNLPLVLVCSVYRLLYKVWHFRHTAAITALKKTKDFWEVLCVPCFDEIQLDKPVSSYHLLIRAYTFHIIANDIYHVPCEETLAMVKSLQERDCFLYWTKVLKRICSSIDELSSDQPLRQELMFNSPFSEAYLSLVRAWRSFIIVTLVVNDNDDDKLKDSITFHIAGALYNQTARLDKRVTLKASAEFASLLAILLKRHKNTSDQPVLVKVCVQVLETATKSQHDLNQIVIIPVLASLLNVFQSLPTDTKAEVLKNSGSIPELIVLLCNQIVLSNPNQLLSLSCAALTQIISTLGVKDHWFSNIKHVLPGIVRLTEEAVMNGSNEVSEALLSLILCVASYKEGASVLQWSNIQRLLCFAQFYPDRLEHTTQHNLWFLVLQIVETMLQTLEMKFAEDAILFTSIRHNRLMSVIGSLRYDFTHAAEAEYFSRLLYNLAFYLDMWHLKAAHCLSDVGTIVGTLFPVISHYFTTTNPKDNPDLLSKMLAILGNFVSMLRVMTPPLLSLLKEKIVMDTMPAPLLAINFSSPILGAEGPPTYGILTNCMRGCMTLLQKIDPLRVNTPTKPDSLLKGNDNNNAKNKAIYCIENLLYVLMSQSQLVLHLGSLDQAELHHFKRELATELKTLLEGVHRHYRRGLHSTSPRIDRTISTSSSMGNMFEHHSLAFFKLGYYFVNTLVQ